MVVFALSDTAITGLFALAAGTVTGVGAVIVALLSRENRRQSRAAEQAVSDWETAWEDRGKLLDGLRADFERSLDRIAVLEDREHNCLDALEDATRRVAVLEARLGVNPGDGV